MKRLNAAVLACFLLLNVGTIGFVALSSPASAALSSPVSTIDRTSAGKYVIPVSQASDWVNVCTDLATADNSGSTVVNPTNITRSAQRLCNLAASGTSVVWRIKYTTGLTITACTIQPFGFDRNGVPERLVDSTGTHPLSFVSDATNDAQDGTSSYTASQETDGAAGAQVLGAVKTLATGTGAATAVLQVRVK